MQPSQGFFSKGLIWLICELIIVFVGVMLAFFVSGWRADQVNEIRAIRTLKILESELADFVRYGPVPRDRMLAELDTFHQEVDAGNLPIPAYYREPRAPTSPVEAWHAVAQSGAYELLEDSLFYALSLHYNRVTHLNESFLRYVYKTEDIIMPYIDASSEVFYEPGTGTLKSEYRWHVRRLKEIARELTLLLGEAAVLRERLEKQIDVLD